MHGPDILIKYSISHFKKISTLYKTCLPTPTPHAYTPILPCTPWFTFQTITLRRKATGSLTLIPKVKTVTRALKSIARRSNHIDLITPEPAEPPG